jgi:Zn-dependent protease with chaperone function
MSAMCIENPLKEGINIFDSLHGLFSTHPPVAERIKALEQMDGISAD